jgi:hypothetical protein
MGTPEYVAPEQATDARQADTRSDIYGLGCTLYALLAGRPPFVGDSAVQIVLAHIEKEPAPLHELRPDVSPELSAVVAKMLAKDPARRYQRPIDVAQALVPFVKAEGRPGAGEVVPPPGVASLASGTVVGGDTRPEKRSGRGRPKPPAKKTARVYEALPVGESAGAPAAWWRRPPVIAGAACAAVTLIVLAGVLVIVLMEMAGGDAPVAVADHPGEPGHGTVAPPTPQEEGQPPAGPGGDDAAGAAQKAPEKPAKPNGNGKAMPPGNAKTAQQKKADEDAVAEARRRAQAKKEADDAAKRELAAKKAEEDRQRKQAEKEAADARKREEARRKAETDAASKLTLAKRLLDDARDARAAGNKEEEQRLRDQYPEALRDIVKKYPETQAAKEAKDLLEK